MIKIYELNAMNRDEVFTRRADGKNVSAAVEDIISDVRNRGDEALSYYTEKFDGVKIENFEVTEAEFSASITAVGKDFMRILKTAAKNISDFHRKQKRKGFSVTKRSGAVIGQRVLPIEKVGIYVPGGTAAYPSTVLMNVIPAKIAGCGEVIITTPPNKQGNVSPYILAAARVAGADKVYKVGGAQAVAALAYGTQSISKVYKITGPGNAFVAEAKRKVFGEVAIDMIAGPSEILVVADKSAEPRFVAADMLSQAEHDKNASAVLVTDCEALAKSVAEEIEKQLPLLERAETARSSIENNGKIIISDTIDGAIEIANELAPEHLELAVEDAFGYLDKVKNAGSVFLGKYCPEAVGDYYAGTNHTLPTSGTAKFSSALSVEDFVKTSQYIYYSKEALRSVYEDIDEFSKKEGLTAHGKSVTVRFNEENR